MRGMLLAGIVILLAGAFVLFRGFSFTKDKTVLDMGPLKATVSEERVVPTWVGGAGVAVGLVLIGVGATKSRG